MGWGPPLRQGPGWACAPAHSRKRPAVLCARTCQPARRSRAVPPRSWSFAGHQVKLQLTYLDLDKESEAAEAAAALPSAA